MAYLKEEVMYKVVQSNWLIHRSSVFSPSQRQASECSRSKKLKKPIGCGKVLRYQPGTTVISPNGLCKCNDECCRGIHAYRTKKEAEDVMGNNIVIRVKGKWWSPYRGSSKVRSLQVEVLD